MRRNCPHCGADQFVADEKLSAGWIFLKCHHCAVTTGLQGKASLRLIQFSERPVRSPAKHEEPRIEFIKPVMSLPPVPDFLKSDRAPGKIEKPAEPMVFEPENQAGTPVPILLEEEKAPFTFKFTSRFSSQLFSQLSGDWKKGITRGSVEFVQGIRPYSLPLMLAIVCFGSGAYLIRSAKQIREGAWVFPIQNPVNVASDVAPIADPLPQVVAQNDAAPVQAQTPVAESPARAPAASAAASIAAASTRVASSSRAPAGASSEEKVEVLAASAVLRAGPGVHYNKVGTARAELQLLVKGSFDNWIEVRTGNGSKTAWIRNDLVKPLKSEIKQVAQQEAQP
jgi:hypothetical protein